MALSAELNVAEALVPTWRITTMQSTIIRASITAYSTAVGPSSFLMNCLIATRNFFMVGTPWWALEGVETEIVAVIAHRLL